jgi:hypothetical protein
MLNPALTFIFLFFLSFSGATQNKSQEVLDLNVAVGETQVSLAGSFLHDWQLGKQRKFSVGGGLRLTSYLGKNQYYITAPASITSESTGPGVLFIENIEENIDTFLIQTPQVNSFNLFINLGFNFSDRFTVGFNIDVVGFSFGNEVQGNYINGSKGANLLASPTSFNVLLISDNDRGSLNSELYGRYFLSDRWGIKAGLSFLFTEYTTEYEVQQFPEPNDRFRRKSLFFTAGVSYKLK